MNYRYFFWILPFIAFTTTVNAVELAEDCIDEPVFSGRVCVYQVNPDYKRSIFLIHGIGDIASRDWNMQLSVLAQDYHIITLDLPGFGRSERGDKPYSPEQYTALIDFIADHYDIHRFDLMGHSMGAAVSILYASKYPNKVRHLVVADVAGILHRLAIGKYVISTAINGNGHAISTDTIESYVVKVIEKFEKVFSFFKDDIAKQNEHVRASIELVDYDFGDALDKIDVPTLIVWGEDDRVAPLRTAKVLNHRIKNSQLEIIKGAGHLPMKDRPEEFNALLMDYLKSIELKTIVVDSDIDMGSKKQGSCNRDRGATFSGVYSRIEITNCSKVVIKNARIDELYIFQSRVVIDDSHIGGDVAVALDSVGSDIKITTSSIRGDIAIRTSRSRFDLAAVDLYPSLANLYSNDNKIAVILKSRIVFSVSRIFRGSEIQGLHESLILKPGDVL